MRKLIQIDGKWKLSAEWLRQFDTIETQEPHDLKLIDDNPQYGKKRYWLGGYFDNGQYVCDVVTVDLWDNKKGDWVQIDQYIGV